MSLLIEPVNKAACIRNEKERLLMQGKLKKKSQEDYLLAHMGLTKAHLDKAASNKQRAGTSTPLKSSSAHLTESALAQHTDNTKKVGRSSSTPALNRPPSRGSMATSVLTEEPRKEVPQDPVLAVLMNGPPLFSPGLCSQACVTMMR
mmetsp:Transcript_96263/g.170980  ORF Transcript_96263/g.170980 Transcript_96263/m.170980 type:complete len:147 (+) Transcript_96263:78-518(+)